MKAQKLTKETILTLGVTDRNFPKFRVGDSIRVAQRIKELAKESEKKNAKLVEKERIQYFEGDVIAVRTHGIATTFTLRKIGANSVGVERVFPYYSPDIAGIELVRTGKVRRAKLFYMRKRVGKLSRTEKVLASAQQKAEAVEPSEASE